MPSRSLLALALVLLASGLAAQTSPFEPFAAPRAADHERGIEAGTRRADGAPGELYWTNSAHYRIEATLDPAAARLDGRAVLTYRNRSPRPVNQLRIHLRQNLHRAGARRTRTVEVTPGFELDAITMDGEEVPARGRYGYRVGGTVMTIGLQAPIPAGGERQLEIRWHFTVPRAGHAPRMGHENNRVFYLGYWYPQFAVFDDLEGWTADPYYGNGEFYMDYADYDVSLTVPEGWLVRATGDHVNPEETLTEEARARLARAMTSREVVSIVDEEDLAAGRATRSGTEGRLTWKFRAEGVRDFAISASDRYLWDATHAIVPDRDGPGKDGLCLIDAVYETNAAPWKRAAEYARHTIEYMSARVHPYPWPHMTACEGIIGGGMEYPMMTLCGTPRSDRGLQSLIGHELIHMWFPMLVGSNEKRYAWMDEGTTSYYSSLVAADFWQREDPARAAIRGYARSMAGRPNERASMGHADHFEGSSFGAASYSKPAAVLHQLRGMLGDETFDRAMRTYAGEWAWKHPRPHDLWNTFSRVAGRDLGWYFRCFHQETWTVDQAVALKAEEGSVRVTVANRGSAVMPTVLELERKDGATERIVIPVAHWLGGSREWSLAASPDVVRARIDPEGLVLDVTPDDDEAALDS
ncbi:MAG: M1 family metallopeptidase [Planctomycetota bacterium]